MSIPLVRARIVPGPVSRNQGRVVPPGERTHDVRARLALLFAFVQSLRARRRNAGAAGVFEHINSALLSSGDFRASDSMGVDVAPSMVFLDTMPPYSRNIDRPARPSD